MRTALLRLAICICMVVGAFHVSAQLPDYNKISMRLSARTAAQQYDSAPIRIGVELQTPLDLDGLSQQLYREQALPAQRSSTVINALKNAANATQPAFVQYLSGIPGVRLSTLDQFWISNIVFVEANANAILEISKYPGVSYIDIDAQLALDEPVAVEILPNNGARVNTPGGHEPGHDAIGAPQMWALGYTGLSRLAMSMDAGVEGSHPALSYKWQGNFKPLAQSWFFFNNPGSTPFDCDGNSSHGTHTMGTICGLEAATNDTIGVAFNARWVHSPSLCGGGGTSSNVAGFQWAIDPDNDPNTTSDMPDVINNSWYDPGTTNECNGLYKTTLDAVEAAGIAVVFSAGNSGSGSGTITQPKNLSNDSVSVFCVGATQKTAPYNIAGFSSRGPSSCGGSGSLLIKPEVSAPGVSVRSSSFTSGYTSLSGTSMAAPHAAGAILLLKEAFPNLTGRQLKMAIYLSATDLGAAGEDNNYGMGMVNVPAAYQWLLNQGHTPAAYNNDAGLADLTNPGITTCDVNLDPVIDLHNGGNSNLTAVTIAYTINPGNITNTFNWTGNLAPGQNTAVTLPTANLTTGSYTITLLSSQPNNQADERPYNDCLVREFSVVQGVNVNDVTIGCPGSATIITSPPPNSVVTWYNAATGGNPIFTGQNYTTPTINNTTTYYVETVTTANGAKSNNAGGGGYFANDTRWLLFDANQDFLLKSVLVYANSAGNRTIQLRNSANTIVQSTTVNVPSGQSRVTLNFNVPAGTGHLLRLNGTADLYRNNAGLSYPYDLPGVFSVYGSNASTATGFYYFFYDWEVEYSSVCGRTPVTVTVGQIQAGIGQSATQVNLAVSGTVNFMDNTTPGPSINWAWDFGDGGTSTQANPSHTYTAPGTYTVTLNVTDVNNCTASTTSTVQVVNMVGLEDELFQAVEIFPNPNQGNFRLRAQLSSETEVKVELYNLLGEQILNVPATTTQNVAMDVDMQNFASGIYYLRLTANGQSLVRKVIRE